MSSGDPVSTPVSVVERAKNILLSPRTEWPVIDAEAATPQSIYIPYVLLLAAIGPIASAIGLASLGQQTIFGVTIGFSTSFIVASAVTQYVQTLIGIFILAFVIDALALNFGGVQDRVKALKLSAYSFTAAMVAGVFAIYPPLSIFVLIGGLYSLYLLYIGLPVLMKSPADKSLAYTVVIIIAAVVVMIILHVIMRAIAGAFTPSTAPYYF